MDLKSLTTETQSHGVFFIGLQSVISNYEFPNTLLFVYRSNSTTSAHIVPILFRERENLQSLITTSLRFVCGTGERCPSAHIVPILFREREDIISHLAVDGIVTTIHLMPVR